MNRIRLVEDLTPISDFRVRATKIVAKASKTKQPLFLTQPGRSAAVLMDIGEYEKKEERLELLEAILKSLQASDKGKMVKHAKAMSQLNKILNG